MRCSILLGVAFGILGAAANAIAEPVTKAEVQRAQGAMLNRITSAVTAYSTSIGIAAEYVTYCYTKLNLETEGHPQDGSVPYGVNYDTLVEGDELRVIIQVREAYEKSFLKLCLAEAKSTLDRAAAR
jgi:hypothetical protein